MSKPTAASRRNGKLASCEPCRTGKIRCDHSRPICGRCQHRGISSRCFYHPAPLTKPRGSGINNFNSSRSASVRSYNSSTVQHSTLFSESTPNSNVVQNVVNAASTERSPTVSSNPVRTDFKKYFDDVAVILSNLRHLDLITFLHEDYNKHSMVALVPGPIMMQAAWSLINISSIITAGNSHDHFNIDSELVSLVLQSTASEDVVIHSDMDYRGFVDLHVASNRLRLEMLGLLYAIAARAFIFRQHHLERKVDNFAQDLLHSSLLCLNIARDIGPGVNDVMLWLSFEVLRLRTNAQGDTHPSVWRQLGEASSDLYSLGIHREVVVTNNTPFWLSECRRKTFASLHQFDKFVATLFERPPRILKRYSDCEMPLDLTDDEILGDLDKLQESRAKLSPIGWSSEDRLCSATWARMRWICGVFREEILEYQYRPATTENIAELKELSNRCHQIWASLPAKLRYNPDIWNTPKPPSASLMLGIVHLLYLQSDFHIHRMLERTDASYTGTYLRIAADIIAAVVHMGNVRDREVFLRHDNSYVMLCYGLPAAAVLVQALRTNGSTLQEGLSRSRLIRNLSVFVSYLESICTPDEANYTVCIQASQAFSRLLDEILEPSAPSTATNTGPQTPNSTANGLRPRAGSPTRSLLLGSEMMGAADFEIASTESWEAFDLDAWLKSIDWTGAGSGCTF